MNGNAELLNYVYQNSEMGVETLDQILDIVKGDELKAQLESEKKEYVEINCRAKKLLNDNGYDEKQIGAMQRMSASLGINMQTMMDKSDSHIAEMLVKGSNMGIVDATKNIHKYEGEAEPDILGLMKDLLKFEEKNEEKLKKFL